MMDYMPIPKGAPAPTLKFETDVEFQKELSMLTVEIFLNYYYIFNGTRKSFAVS